MGQWNQVKTAIVFFNTHKFPDQIRKHGQFVQELADCQFANGNHEPGPEDVDFRTQPCAAFGDLFSGGNSITPLRILARKTAADSRHVNRLAKLRFGNAGFLLEPFKHRFAGSPGKWAPQAWFFNAGRLANKHNTAQYRFAADRVGLHFRTSSARMERIDMMFELHLTV
jgi:hypothetical protein